MFCKKMMKVETRIRIAAGLALATAIWTILPAWRSHVFMFRGISGYAAVAGVGWAIFTVLLEAILIAHLASAIGLFRLHRWAWVLAVVSLSVQVLLISVVAMRLVLLPPPPPPPVTPGSFVTTHSLLPAYFRNILNGIAVLILYSRGVRSHFLNQTNKSHNKSGKGSDP